MNRVPLPKILAAVVACVLAGCGKQYHVEMAVVDGKVQHRTVILAGSSSRPADAASQPTTEIVGDIDGIGAAGHLLTYRTSLGQACIYIESVRGNDHPAEVLQRRFAAADTLSDLLMQYVRQRFAKHPESTKLQKFFDQDFRRDIKDISTYAYMASAIKRASAEGDQKASVEFTARLLQLLLDRGYIAQDDVPLASRLANQPQGEDLVALAGGILRRMAGITDDKLVAALLAQLPPDSPDSFNEVLKDHPAVVAYAKQRAAQAATPSSQPIQEPAATASDLAASALGDLTGELATLAVVSPVAALCTTLFDDKIEMSLPIDGDLVYSAGSYDAKTRQVTWRYSMRPPESSRRSEIPALPCAVWVKSDAAFQKTHFGRTIIDGPQLAMYCLWRAGLDSRSGERWDALLASLTPQDFIHKINAFEAQLRASQGESGGALGNDSLQQWIGIIRGALADKAKGK